ncbi:chemotaxis response regulator protein-glutamate methylesterase [Novosphingobium sp. PC22D]|uniref:protein-glutamate methylesterase/protein-glutamine glutaminase n=1 Tax=Novosphingobium sp. PC22D TaxID=1962403 RepID=UPI000BEF8121|nr:chemotaxis response regulator protein-glutamate methylesterase [Novosphingobium sp. PC22D]PEQ13418.1 chemotaxis response regulator protein-glutamate methylesterase [Novosphingobium sp. PC22D]
MTTRVLVIDDSASVRAVLSQIIEGAPGLSLMGTASDPFIAAKRIREEVPDVIILDIEMPRMDGITFLRRLMAQHPLPVVICSGIAGDGSAEALAALEAGAVEVITKPRAESPKQLSECGLQIINAVRAASHARVGGRRPRELPPLTVEQRNDANVILGLERPQGKRTEPVICLGASTGGTEAIRAVLAKLPANAPGMAIVQHMPANFTGAFARRLDQLCAVEVKEAEDGDLVAQGRVLIAPGNRHMLLRRQGANYVARLVDGPAVSRHRPSVDVLFRSAVGAAGGNALGILLTGMGDDGARGLSEMRDAGAWTIAQDEASCVVFGMPREAIERGAAREVLALDAIPRAAIKFADAHSAA